MTSEIIETILLFCFGGIIAMIIDVVWWNIDYKKAEKGLEVLEHYHIGIMLFIAAILADLYLSALAWTLMGMGFLFIIAEWHQSIQIVDKKVVPGKPFAYGSKHFKASSIIGIALSIILLIISIFL